MKEEATDTNTELKLTIAKLQNKYGFQDNNSLIG